MGNIEIKVLVRKKVKDGDYTERNYCYSLDEADIPKFTPKDLSHISEGIKNTISNIIFPK